MVQTPFDDAFRSFLLQAKKATYAGGDRGKVASSRPASHDLAYQEGEWSYIDTYLGGIDFLGEEAVWKSGLPVWGMNYCGAMTVDAIPDGFGDFLKLALRSASPEAPYRGPGSFADGRFAYTCRSEGDLAWFAGEESITFDGRLIYKLTFHGGAITG